MKDWRKIAGLCFMVALLAAAVSCEMPWDDDDDDVAGTSTITGNVESYDVAGVSYTPTDSGLLAVFNNLVVPSAEAGLGGVTVQVKGTDLVATSAADGSFVISGVPAGNRTLIFTYNGQTAEYPITIAANTSTRLRNVSITAAGVAVATVTVTDLPGTSSSSSDDDEDDDDPSNPTMGFNIKRGN